MEQQTQPTCQGMRSGRCSMKLLHKAPKHRGEDVDNNMADRIMALVMWDAARGRDSTTNVITAMKDSEDDTWRRLTERLQLALVTGDVLMNSGLHTRLSRRDDSNNMKYAANQELRFHPGNSSRGNS